MTQTDPTTGERAEARSPVVIRPVVVGADGSDGARSAVGWAAAEAVRTGAVLRIVTVVDEHPHLPRFPLRLGRGHAADHVTELAATTRERFPQLQVETEVYDGAPPPVLVDVSDNAGIVVVGKRGLSAIPRMIVGSTSLSVAGRAACPVVVVPTGWQQAEHAGHPLVVGVDPYRPSEQLLETALLRARSLTVPLVAVHGWEAPSAPVWSDSPLDEWERESHEKFAGAVTDAAARVPGVEVRTVASHHHPAVAVCDEAERGAQLALLGRREKHHAAGFAFGSVTRAVLHYATVPVMVVPTPDG